MNLSGALSIVAAGLAGQFAPLRVESHGGRFTEREIAMLLGKAPCVLAAVLGVSRVTARGRERWAADLRLGAYCLGADTPAESRADLAMDRAIEIVDLLPAQLWGKTDQDCRPPDIDTIAADNLYTGHINNLRVALWAVAWTQTFFFDHGVPP
ncbi:MAG: hypothetical protein V9G63_16275 [Candidatus Competibacter sp.]